MLFFGWITEPSSIFKCKIERCPVCLLFKLCIIICSYVLYIGKPAFRYKIHTRGPAPCRVSSMQKRENSHSGFKAKSLSQPSLPIQPSLLSMGNASCQPTLLDLNFGLDGSVFNTGSNHITGQSSIFNNIDEYGTIWVGLIHVFGGP